MTNPDASNHSDDSRVNIIQSVRSPLGFFVLVVLVVEALFGVLSTLSSGQDRTLLIIGMLALVFLLVIIVAVFTARRPGDLLGNFRDKETASELGKDIASVPTISQSPEQTENLIVGKEKDFVINVPRTIWNVAWKSFLEIMEEESGFFGKEVIDDLQRRLIGIDLSAKNVLRVNSNKKYEITPIIGTSKRNELPYLAITHPTIIPGIFISSKNKFSSLFGRKESLIAYALDRISGLLLGGFIPKSIISGTRSDGKSVVIAEIESSLEAMIINGIPDQDMLVRSTLVCLEGRTKLYSIGVQDVQGDLVISEDRDRLNEIAKSFRIIEDIDDSLAIQAAQEEGENERNKHIANNSEELFFQNFYILAGVLSRLDFTDNAATTKAVNLSNEFFKLAEIYSFPIPPDLMEFQEDVDNALAGDREGFLNSVKTLVEIFS